MSILQICSYSLHYTVYGHDGCEQGTSMLRFSGQRKESFTGYYLLGNGYRAYNPDLMRFNSPDTLSPFGAGGINPYSYCGGDPVNWVDPSGHTKRATTPKLPSLSGRTSTVARKQPGQSKFDAWMDQRLADHNSSVGKKTFSERFAYRRANPGKRMDELIGRKTFTETDRDFATWITESVKEEIDSLTKTLPASSSPGSRQSLQHELFERIGLFNDVERVLMKVSAYLMPTNEGSWLHSDMAEKLRTIG